MTTNVPLDEELLRAFIKSSHAESPQTAVEEGMRELIAMRHQLAIRDLFGSVEFSPGYDYKAMREGRSLEES